MKSKKEYAYTDSTTQRTNSYAVCFDPGASF